jgi:uncharacterized repeat protein (TIGR03803 family)
MNQLSVLKTIFFLGVFCAVVAMAAAVTFAAPGGFFKTRVNFDGTNGAQPVSPLVKAINGNFYGITGSGGTGTDCSSLGCGTVFKVTPGGRLTTLYSFCSKVGCEDGRDPNGLIQASDGNFYGTTDIGGKQDKFGKVFKLSPSGTLTTLYPFCSQPGCTDGDGPNGLIQASDGNFYGTTAFGGAHNGGGTVFQLSPTGTLTTLYSFCSEPNCTDGDYPNGLIQASDGNFYGTTNGGAHDGGTVFQLSPTGTLTTLYSFCSEPNCTDGDGPGGLIQASDGNFYGTTYYGGAYDKGTVFQLSPMGTLTTLHSFHGSIGTYPTGLIQAPSGNFWGTTEDGGSSNDGTVFVLGVGLGPFVETLPTSGTVGTPVTILGFKMNSATSVTFNGTPATFQVIWGNAIKTTVPSGATTGPVTVTTPSRTLTSNVNFQVN